MGRFENDELRKLIGKRIMGARTLRGVSQSELAKELSVSRCTISNLENGKSMVGADTLLEILEILDMGFEELLPEYTSLHALGGGNGVYRACSPPHKVCSIASADAFLSPDKEVKGDMEQDRFLSELEVLVDRMIARHLEQMKPKDMNSKDM